MSAEENKAVYQGLMEEVINGRRLDQLARFLAPDVVRHGAGGSLHGEAAAARLHQQAAAFLAAFPDLRVAIDDIIAEGDRVAARATMTGTHQGAFMGVPATGRSIRVQAIDIVRIADGRIVEYWAQGDMLGLLQQLGAIPAPGQAAADANRDQTT